MVVVMLMAIVDNGDDGMRIESGHFILIYLAKLKIESGGLLNGHPLHHKSASSTISSDNRLRPTFVRLHSPTSFGADSCSCGHRIYSFAGLATSIRSHRQKKPDNQKSCFVGSLF